MKKQIISDYFIEKYKKLDEITETIQNSEANPFVSSDELERLDNERRTLENIESELEEWIIENDRSD